MRKEQWYWLPAFCLVSLLIHLGMVYESRSFTLAAPPIHGAEIEITLDDTPAPQPPAAPAEKKPEDRQKPRAAPDAKPAPISPAATKTAEAPPKAAQKPMKTAFNPPRKTAAESTASKPDVGGMERLNNEAPLAAGLPTKSRPPVWRFATGWKRAPTFGGGGSPAPALAPGKGGAPLPEAPPENIIYEHGGAGGRKLPQAPARIGGGGGRSILSVENPLAKEQAPDETPGLGAGHKGGAGMGSGGGAGYGRGKGIGTRADGRDALASLNRKPGTGIGAGAGNGIGTRSPGGGRGTGAELPGTGGEGTGYNRGKGIGIGKGDGAGPGAGGLPGIGLSRGIPFGDVTGLLDADANGGGGRNGGPGGNGRSAVFGARPIIGGGGRIHIVYLLDSSGSMRDGNKIGKAKEALKKALSELKPRDTFNVFNFDHSIHRFSEKMLPAQPENIQQAMAYVDGIKLHDDTNLSGALEAAFTEEQITHVFILSDGEPHTGVEDFGQLRDLAQRLNRQKARIFTLALGLGEHFKGMTLLKALAEDNNGEYHSINLSDNAKK